MSRSGYSCDLDNWDYIRWRGAVTSAIRGKRGQAMLRELLAALEAMPDKRLITEALTEGGDYCTLGVLGAARGLDLGKWDPDDIDPWGMAEFFGIPRALAAEIMYENDETPVVLVGNEWRRETPEQRWQRMRAWVVKHLKPEAAP